MFNAQNPVDTVHSQMRRMVMVSPEPNFWIHAVSFFSFLFLNFLIENTSFDTFYDIYIYICIYPLDLISSCVQCIELAKVPRVVYEKGKGKGKEKKGKLKGKEREKDKDKDEPGYDCEDSSVHDGALKEDIMRGYERFKVCLYDCFLVRAEWSFFLMISSCFLVDTWIVYLYP